MGTALASSGAPAPPASTALAAPAGPTEPVVLSRDPALDLVRAVALVRVVLWHMFAATWMTVFAAIPLMFFVSGSLLVHADKPQPYWRLLKRRGKRLLIPLWAYGAAVLGATLLHADTFDWPRTASDLWRAFSWIVPVVDPADSQWHGGWLANHLWYLRAYLWILVLSPVLAVLARRLAVAVPLFVLAIVQLEVASYFELPIVGEGSSRVLIGDVVTYGFFVVLGMAYRLRRREPKPAGMLVGAAVTAAAAIAFATKIGLPEGGINASYIAIALTGVTWVLLAGASARPLRTLATVPAVNRFSRLMTRRAVTIYLWHPAAIVVAYSLVRPDTAARPLALATWTIVIAVIAAFGAGWVEDVTAGRAARRRVHVRLPELRLTALVASAAAVLAFAVPALVVEPNPAAAAAAANSASSQAGPRAMPPPSYRDALANSAFSQKALDPSKRVELRGGKLPNKRLQKALEQWMASPDARGIQSVAAAVTVNGKTWTGEAHQSKKKPATHDESRYEVYSLTKTFTAALVLREAEAGRIKLDAPVPRLKGISRPARAADITWRQLLQHKSGLVDFTEVPGYRADRPLPAAQAVSMALRTPLLHKPGTAVHYSNANYLYLGLLLEQLTKRPYADQVRDLVQPLGLKRTAVDAPGRPGWPGLSSGGVRSTVGDMARWGEALFTPGRVVSAESVRLMKTLDEHNVGLGTWPLCPCGIAPGGVKQYTAIGHYVGNGGFYRFNDGTMMVLHFEPPLVQFTDAQVASLSTALRGALRR